MQKFLVLYKSPVEGLEEWMKVDPEIREAEEAKMKAAWDAWMEEHRAQFAGQMTAGAGKTKLVTEGSVVDSKNDIMLCSIIEAESHDAAAEIFKDCPHFGIPNSSIEVMPLNPLPDVG